MRGIVGFVVVFLFVDGGSFIRFGFHGLGMAARQIKAFHVDEQRPIVGSASALQYADDFEGIVIGGVFCNNVGLPMFGDLAYNICNWMAERKVLMNIQSSKHNAQQMVLQPQQVERVRWLLVYGVPLAFLGLGLVVLYLRRRA